MYTRVFYRFICQLFPIIAIASVCFTLIVKSASIAEAQVQDPRWSVPYRLSTQQGEASGAALVADHYGYAHAFWIERGFPDNRMLIQYARFDGERWNGPIDIYMSWPGIPIASVNAYLDQEGHLNLAWTEGNQGPIFHMSAPAYNALSAWHWTKPQRIDIPAYRFTLRVDSSGIWHILYSEFYGEHPGVYYTYSEDHGANWAPAICLDPDRPTEFLPLVIGLRLDDNENLHAIWDYIEITSSGSPQNWIRYAHLLRHEPTWSLPVTIDRDEGGNNQLRGANPILFINGNELHLIYAGDEQTHRHYRMSKDLGATWSNPSQLFGNLHGQAGDGLAVDSTGNVHYLAQIRYPQGIYHATWSKGMWSIPSLVYLISQGSLDPRGDRIHAHSISAVVRAGHQLIITFTNEPGEPQMKLYTMHRTLEDIPPLQPRSTPTVMPSPTPIATIANLTPAFPQSTATALFPEAPPLSKHNGLEIWIGVLSSTLLVFGIIILHLTRRPQ